MAVTEADLLAALQLKFMTAAETVDTSKFTASGTPAFEGSTSAFPNSRTEKFVDFNGSTDWYTFDPRTECNLENGIVHLWIKPDFNQASATATAMLSGYDTSTTDGPFLQFDPSLDDWLTQFYIDGSTTGRNPATAGETWSADDVIHIVYMYKSTAGLDSSKSIALYVNNTLKASATGTWTPTGDDWAAASKLGAIFNNTQQWDGGIFDFAIFDYDSLAASYTDAEIVQALYSNILGGGTTHKFVYELAAPAVPTAPSDFTNTAVTSSTASFTWTDNSSDETGFKIYDDSDDSLLGTFGANEESGTITGLDPDTEYTVYLVAYNVTGNSIETATVTFTTDVAPTAGLTIAGRKIRLRTDTGGTVTTAMEIDSSQNTITTGYAKSAMMRQVNTWHAFGGFQGESELLSIDADSWTHVTNSTDDLWTAVEAVGFTMSDDELVVANAGDYIGVLSVTFEGSNTKDYLFRIYNITQAAVSGYRIGATGLGSGNYTNVAVPIYLEADAGDHFRFEVYQVNGSDATFLNAIFNLTYLHE